MRIFWLAGPHGGQVGDRGPLHTTACPCRGLNGRAALEPCKPRDKAKVEVGVQVVERWILARLRHRRFFSLSEVNQAIRALLVQLNERPFRKLPGCRRSLFEQLDRPAMRPLAHVS